MIIPDILTSQLENLIAVLDNCYYKLSHDKFRYNKDQIFVINSIKFEFDELAKFKVDTFLANLKNNHSEKSVLNGLNQKLTDYTKLYKLKSDKIANFNKSVLLESILDEYKFKEKIKILEDDIADIEDERNEMPEWLKEKECQKLSRELENIKSDRQKSSNELSYIKNDYYGSIFIISLEIEKKIDDYFPDNRFTLETDLVKLSLTVKIHDILISNEVIDPKKLSIEDFFLIINHRKPLNNCRDSVKKLVLMSFPINEIAKNIKQSDLKSKYINYVADKLGLNVNTITNKTYKNTKFKMFYMLFGIKED